MSDEHELRSVVAHGGHERLKKSVSRDRSEAEARNRGRSTDIDDTFICLIRHVRMPSLVHKVLRSGFAHSTSVAIYRTLL